MPRNVVPPVVNLIRAMLKLRSMNGRELAIVGAAWLDAAVELNLRYNMRHQSGVEPEQQVLTRGLRGLEARLWVADAFGLFATPDVRRQADLVRRVRNEFAHSIEDLDCDSPRIAPLIDQMTLTTEEVQAGLTIDPSARGYAHRPFIFDGETFADVAAIVEAEPLRLLFFVPDTTPPTTRDERLRNQIHATVYGVLGLGLKSWLMEEGYGGVLDLTEPPEQTEQRAHEQ